MNKAKEIQFLENLGELRLFNAASAQKIVLGLVLLTVLAVISGCETEDCVNCVELPAPVVPTGVHSISGDNVVWVQWYDISYFPYDGTYNPNVSSYAIYSRYYMDGDEQDASREFYYMGDVAWDENFDDVSGLHWFADVAAENGERYEYAVAAVNANGEESALSYELVTDAPLPHSLAPVVLYDKNLYPDLSGFDFSLIDDGADSTTPGFDADIEIQFQGGVPYVQRARSEVLLQDFGVFTDANHNLIFEGVSWAPENGYSSTNVMELIAGHIYVVKITDGPYETHFAKFGVLAIRASQVDIVWAYQTISGLPELSIPADDGQPAKHPGIISL